MPDTQLDPFPYGWAVAHLDGKGYTASHAQAGSTGFRKTRDACLDEARAIHARKIAAGDISETEVVAVEAVPAEVEPAPHEVVPVEVVARERVAAQGQDRYDAETGEWLPVSPAMVERERQMREAFALGKLMQAVVVREIVDQKLYLAAGAESFADYAEDKLDLGRSTAYDLYRVGSRYSGFLPAQTQKMLDLPVQNSGLDDEGSDSDVQDAVRSTSFWKLLELTRADESSLDTLLDGAEIQLADGRSVSMETIRRSSTREAKEIIKQLKREYRAKLARDQERADLAEAERDVYRERADAAQETVATLRDGERLWGPRQLHAEGQIKLMESAEQHLKALGLAVDQIDPDADVPDAVARAAGSLLHRFATHHGNLRDRLAPLTARL